MRERLHVFIVFPDPARAAMTPCPIPNCTNLIPPEHVMCGTHWRVVPARMRTAVHAAWRDVKRDYPAGPGAHRHACEQAIAEVVRRLERNARKR